MIVHCVDSDRGSSGEGCCLCVVVHVMHDVAALNNVISWLVTQMYCGDF